MVHHPPTTAQVTLYRLTPALGGDPAGLVQAKYLDNGFVRDRVELAGIGCVVVSGVIARDGPPEWTEHLADLTGIDAAVENRTGAGLLLIRSGLWSMSCPGEWAFCCSTRNTSIPASDCASRSAVLTPTRSVP